MRTYDRGIKFQCQYERSDCSLAVPGLEVGPDPALDVVVQLALVHVEDEGVGVEGVVELVDEDGEPPDLLGEGLAHLVLDVLGDAGDLLLHLAGHELELLLGEVEPVRELLLHARELLALAAGF